jgi:hypothetical protein
MAELGFARYTFRVNRARPAGAAGALFALSGIVLAALVVAACGNAPLPSEDSSSSENTGAVSSGLTMITRSAAVARGQQWVAAKVPYCQAPNHQHDDDKACNSTCIRPDNVLWDPYRSDCSGFVSWSWGLPAPGRTTAELAPAVVDITHTIDPKSLMPGDAVNKPSDHTMLFVEWLTPGKRARFIEEPGCSNDPPYAHQVDSDVTIKGTTITVVENGITFSAIRFDAIVDDPPDAGAGDADASTPTVRPEVDAGDQTPPRTELAAPDADDGGCATTPGGTRNGSSGLPVVVAAMLLLGTSRRRKTARR